MPDKSTKDELKLEAAKALILGSLNRNDTLFTSLLTTTSILIPGYPAVLGLSGLHQDSINVIIRLAPEFLWIASLGVCIYHLYPRLRSFDLGNVNGILEGNARQLFSVQSRARWAVAFFLTGVIVAMLVFGLATVPPKPGSPEKAPATSQKTTWMEGRSERLSSQS